MRLRSFIAPILLLGALAGCGTPSLRPASPSRSAATQAYLVAEQRRLAALFEGTPVVFAMQPEGGLRVEVPLRYCFDPGKSVVKPPLAAVLDRIARSQLKESTRMVVSAPNDPGGKSLKLATARAVSARDHMVAHGIAATRFAVAAMARSPVVRIVVDDAPEP